MLGLFHVACPPNSCTLLQMTNFLFEDSMIFYCVCMSVSHFPYPFIHWWTHKFFPYLGYYEWCIINMGVQIFFSILIWNFLDMFPEERLLDHMRSSVCSFWGTSIPFSIMDVLVYISNIIQEFPFLASSPMFVMFHLFDKKYSNHCT